MNSKINRTETVRKSDDLKRGGADGLRLEFSGMTESFFLVEFSPKDAPESHWSAYFAFSETFFREFNPRGRLPNRETVRRLFSTTNSLYTVKRYLLLDAADRAVAYTTLSYDTDLSPDYETSSHIGHLLIEVAPSYRRKKIALHLLGMMIGQIETLGKDTVRADADHPMGVQFCKYLKGELIHREVEHRLYLEDVDWPLMDQWCEKGKSRFPGTVIESFQECPAKDIEEFCDTYTKIINQRPVGDIQEALITTPESRRLEERNLKKRGSEWHTLISREDDGQISALTDIMYNPQEPHRIDQYFTGVLEKYRRRGLAKRLKAEMIIYIRDRFPDAEYVKTTTAHDNKPMRAINKQVGFEPKKTCYMFRWDLQRLSRRLHRILSAGDRAGTKKRIS